MAIQMLKITTKNDHLKMLPPPKRVIPLFKNVCTFMPATFEDLRIYLLCKLSSAHSAKMPEAVSVAHNKFHGASTDDSDFFARIDVTRAVRASIAVRHCASVCAPVRSLRRRIPAELPCNRRAGFVNKCGVSFGLSKDERGGSANYRIERGG